MAIISNQATLSYNGNVVTSNVATGEIIEVLEASKTAVSASYGQGDVITYVISIVNTGTTPVTGVSVTDDLGGYAFGEETLYPLSYEDGTLRLFENGVLQATPAVTAGPPLSVSGVTVPAEGNVVLVYSAAVTQYAPPGTGAVIENTATVEGGGVLPFTVTESIPAAAEPELAIEKSIAPAVVKTAGELSYTFVIRNYGAAEAAASANVKITDALDPILSGLSATLDGAPMSDPSDYSYDETTGIFETVEGAVTVPAAAFTQDAATGVWTVTPGETTLVITGTVG